MPAHAQFKIRLPIFILTSGREGEEAGVDRMYAEVDQLEFDGQKPDAMARGYHLAGLIFKTVVDPHSDAREV
jgi:hypothetical protein